MANHTNIILILGSGPNIGQAVATKFADNGYKVALVSRSQSTDISPGGHLGVQADLSLPKAVPEIFQKVKDAFGVPNIVVYNGAHRLTTPPDDPFSASLETLEASRKVGLDSAYVAAQEALKGFKTLPEESATAFIYTGNALSQIAIPGVIPFALGKVAAQMVIEYAANAYGKDGYRFYFADERQKDGRPAAMDVDGAAHAAMYWDLANEAKQSKWLVTFTKDVGRKEYVGVDFEGETRESYDRKFDRV